MAISTLAGVIDAGVYVLGYIPTGVDVGADFTQIINKLNESIGVINTNEADIATNDSALTTQSALIQGNTDDLAAYEVSNDAAVAALDVRVVAVEAGVGNSLLTLETPGSLTISQMTSYGMINIQSGGGSSVTATLPVAGALPASPPKVTLINTDYTTVTIKLDNGNWADGSAGSDSANYLILFDGGAVTLYPFEADGGGFTWGILSGTKGVAGAGLSYADLEDDP